MNASRITVYVGLTISAALAWLVAAWPAAANFPGFWGVGVLLLVAFLLQVSALDSRGGDAEGSLSFVVHLAAGVLFGGFWGAVVAGLSTLMSQLRLRREPLKASFNVAQRVLAVLASMQVFQGFGGTTPPEVLLPGAQFTSSAFVVTVLAFLTAAAVYFLVNSLLVFGAVAISTRKSFAEVWAKASVWVFGYDVGASAIALFVAWLYLKFDGPMALSRLGFLLFVVPLIVAKHVYAKLNTLQGLYDQLDRAHHQLELALREQLEMMVKSIEARDPYTSGHSRRVSALSKAIAQDLGMTGEDLAEVESAALLHDVGKIHAEFAPLLQKEGRLTQDEWEIMKTHAAKSAELVGLFSRFRGSVQSSVRSHHERWDGKGYPDGLAGSAIPFGARIIMISDTIDAMTTDRPYRKALSFEKVVAELQKYRGSQFDPSIVDATVNSVTVRRLVSDKEFLAEQTSARPQSVGRPRPALRSQSSFLEALRSGISPSS
ncbi:MAG: HD-GYP domain-containing protein [Gemmatimonadales bacterium]|nr:HD-GYP domain-containing protein [Gemmatimonadales bacterium]